ncbi:adenosylcobinamide-phosphate synthase CbiB [Marimonas sp. MJW-29]|uniref:Cobalamin biosynthesis protein CobD n=1 Tax=Sulfitobacter sediminis TaxID=3234186 RepID=A0ABV3RHG7_9RHOB
MSAAFVLIAALLLDAALGEPGWLWRRMSHPAVLMGRVIGWGDRKLNTGGRRRLKGIAFVLAIVVSAGGLGGLLSALGTLAEIVIVGILLAQKSLVEHVRAVADGLRLSLPQGRRAVSLIVSRDTAAMTGPAVARSAIESASENLSDGVVAPAFWFLIGGLPGILIYKIVNTADSMIGYRTERHADFGWAAARLDDVLNYVPARLTAALIALRGGQLGAWGAIRADARQHRSPNAGWPEAAMARAIDVALAGPRAYDGRMQEFAWVNPAGRREIGPPEIDAAASYLWRTWQAMLILILALSLIAGW